VVERFDTEVYRFLAQGAKSNQVLSSNNKDSLGSGYGLVWKAIGHMRDIMDRAGMDYNDYEDDGDIDTTPLQDGDDDATKALKASFAESLANAERIQNNN